MCDVRRDQVALLLTMLDSLTGKSWIGQCMTAFRTKNIDPTRMGFELNHSGRSVNFDPSIVAAYENRIRDEAVLSPTTTAGEARKRGSV